jgi:hypothetical protein
VREEEVNLNVSSAFKLVPFRFGMVNAAVAAKTIVASQINVIGEGHRTRGS